MLSGEVSASCRAGEGGELGRGLSLGKGQTGVDLVRVTPASISGSRWMWTQRLSDIVFQSPQISRAAATGRQAEGPPASFSRSCR